MRSTPASRLARYMRGLRPDLTPGERKAFLQCGWVQDVLKSYQAYLTDRPGDRDIINACIHALDKTNPMIKEYFVRSH